MVTESGGVTSYPSWTVYQLFKLYIEQNSLYFLISGKKSLKWFLILCVLLRIQFP